jgi:hypothetical protein
MKKLLRYTLLLPVLLLRLLLLPACTQVDSTEHCVLTRYGKIVQEKMDTGLSFTPFTESTCFTMTEQNFPEETAGKETIEAQTKDPVTVTGDVAIVYSFDPGTIIEVFREKRSPEAAEAEILNAIREGYRNALAGWTVTEIFSERRPFLSDSMRMHIQRKIGTRARIHQVFVRDIKIPSQIEEQRIAAAAQEQVLQRAQRQFDIDSVNASALLMRERTNADANRLRAESYESNPALLQLDIARAQADGISKACQGANVSTCVIRGSVLDTWKGQ